jgi:hypothetical protein
MACDCLLRGHLPITSVDLSLSLPYQVGPMKAMKRIVLYLLIALTACSVVIFVVTLISAMVFRDFGQQNDKGLGMILVFAFGCSLLGYGIIGMVTGSVFNSMGETKAVKERNPTRWLISNVMFMVFGIGFLAWGFTMVSKWIITA